MIHYKGFDNRHLIQKVRVFVQYKRRDM